MSEPELMSLLAVGDRVVQRGGMHGPLSYQMERAGISVGAGIVHSLLARGVLHLDSATVHGIYYGARVE